MYRGLGTFLALMLAVPVAAVAADGWPGLPPDCWIGPRLVHSVRDLGDLWQQRTRITTRQGDTPEHGETSPNGGYVFVVEKRPSAANITIYAEQDHLVEIGFTDLAGLSDARWINEKLIFLRSWWGRIAATDLIFDVEQEKFVYAETVTDGTIAHRQYLESCPLHGCTCVEKR